jgi:hypothetical protein
VLSYDVTLRQGRATWDAPIETTDLAPQVDVEADAPALVAQAAQLTGSQSSEETERRALRIYTFTARHLSWPKGERIGGTQSALSAYETGIGVCGEFANLMTALCRAVGIPARPITGLLLPIMLPPYMSKTTTWLHPGGAHAWVEVHTGEHWRLADPSWASRLPFARLWFGRSLGAYLSYGESGAHARIYDDMQAWAEGHGEIIGAMSSPLHFAAAAGGEGITLQPLMTLQKGWDGRWFSAVGLYVGVVVGALLLERRLQIRN